MSDRPEQEFPTQSAGDAELRQSDDPMSKIASDETPITNISRSQEALEPELFANIFAPEPAPQIRIPNLGHVGILVLVALCAVFIAALLSRVAVYFHFLGVTSMQQAQADVRYTLGSEGLFYLLSLLLAWGLFPLLWQRTFFSGIHWNGFIAIRTGGRLMSIALLCFLLALVNGYLMPGPSDTPIDRIFRMPGAAWLLFGFGVTMAPFFEELAFRGFLLPALCTAFDWIREQVIGVPRHRIDPIGNPDWSLIAMILGTVITSLPFALMHAYQTGYSLGPFLLLFVISIVLCGVRLVTRSLAASVFVHAGYNFLLFIFMLVGTGGFKHLEHM